MHMQAQACTHTPGKYLLSTEIYQSGTPRTGKISEDHLRASFSKLYVVTGRPTTSSRPPSDPFRSNYSEVTTSAGTRHQGPVTENHFSTALAHSRVALSNNLTQLVCKQSAFPKSVIPVKGAPRPQGQGLPLARG